MAPDSLGIFWGSWASLTLSVGMPKLNFRCAYLARLYWRPWIEPLVVSVQSLNIRTTSELLSLRTCYPTPEAVYCRHHVHPICSPDRKRPLGASNLEVVSFPGFGMELPRFPQSLAPGWSPYPRLQTSLRRPERPLAVGAGNGV